MKYTYSTPLIVTSAFTLTFIVGVWVVILPAFATVTLKLHTLDSLTSTSTKPVVKATPTPTVTQNSDLVLALLPRDDHQYDLSVQVEALCRQNNVQILTLGFSGGGDPLPTTAPVAGTAPATSTAVKKLSLSLSISGTYAAIQQTVVGLTALNRFIQVDTLAITEPSGKGTVLSADITASAYYLPGGK